MHQVLRYDPATSAHNDDAGSAEENDPAAGGGGAGAGAGGDTAAYSKNVDGTLVSAHRINGRSDGADGANVGYTDPEYYLNDEYVVHFRSLVTYVKENPGMSIIIVLATIVG